MENWIWRVTAILPETADMKTIVLERRSGEPAPYQAGQFLTLLFNTHGRELRRSYSFSSAPAVDAGPAITVKRVVNGEVSRRLLDHLRVGDVAVSLPPAGRFTLEDNHDFHVFIAAGSGLVPVFALLKELRAKRPEARVMLLTQQHDAASTPFRDALTGMGVDWTDVLTVRDGRLTKDRLMAWIRRVLTTGGPGLENDARAAGEARFYLCGPPDFMRWVQIVLRTMGIADDRVKREHFTVGPIPAAPPVFDASPRKVVVRAEIDREFVATWPESILTAAIRQGIPLPYSCRAGRCSSCVAHCVRGRVRMANNEVLTERDLAAGLVLTCVGYAETDVELDYARSSETKASGSSVPDLGTT
jgi:ring-1,2-phenylacetyl-CoA epoxidase subunit PaaE